MTRRIRIKSKSRFLIFLLICMFILTGVFNTMTGAYDAIASDSPQSYISVNVSSGDTLWDIAETYMPQDMDTREAVYIIKKVNNISSTVRDGQTILIPEYS